MNPPATAASSLLAGRETAGAGWRAWAVKEAVRDDLLALLQSDTAASPQPGPTGRGRVWRTDLGGRPALVKEHRHGGWAGRLLRLLPGDGSRFYLGASRLRRTTAVALAFRSRGGESPAPLAWAALGRAPAVRLFSATSLAEGLVSIDQPLRAATIAGRRRLLGRLGQSLAAWHHAGLAHPDLNLGNILATGVAADKGGGAISVIDLDGARLMERLTPTQRARALARLERSGLRLLGAALLPLGQRARLLVGYCREAAALAGGQAGDARLLRRQLLPPLRRRRLLFVLHGVSRS